VTGRIKSISSTFRKLLKDGMVVERVKDVLALRVVLLPAGDSREQLATLMRRDAITQAKADALLCFTTYRQVLRLWNEVPGRFKDFISRPKPNGYQSLHTNVRLPDGRIAEVQVRTYAMHQFAEHGQAAHGFYKGGLTNPTQLANVAGALEAVRSLPALPPSPSENAHRTSSGDNVLNTSTTK